MITVGGCVVGPRYHVPVEAPVAIATIDPSIAIARPPAESWWGLFDDPVLDALVLKAGRDNLDLRQALGRVRASRALFDDARLDRFPRVSSGADYQRSREQRPGLTTEQTTVEQFDLGFDATWELDLFGHVKHQIESARADAEATRFDADDAKVVVTAEVVRNYLVLRGAQARRAVAENNARSQAETLRLTEVRVDVGTGDPVDVQTARARLEATRGTIPEFTITERHAAHRLAVLVGQRPGELDATLTPVTSPVTPAVRALPVGDVSAFLRRRPDVRAAERRLAAQTARVGVATADLFPRIRITGFLGLLSGDVSSLFTKGGGAYAVAPSVTWPAFDLGGARARLRAQKAEADVNLAAYDQTVLKAIEDLQNAVVAYGQRQKEIASLTSQMDAARRASQLANVRYKEGDIDFLRLLEAQRQQLDAEDSLTRAEIESNTDVVAVYKALGGAYSE
ncbi:efflux transporter outer membrane subunit [Sphingomonas glacialis]|nr:efflux transporter outer membrane subunit [Sphingomonas glacialis]